MQTIQYLSVDQVLALHAALVRAYGGGTGLRHRGGREAAVPRPAATFGGEDLYHDLAAKAAALMHSLVLNHPFVDGNKRVGVAAAELVVMSGGIALATLLHTGEFEAHTRPFNNVLALATAWTILILGRLEKLHSALNWKWLQFLGMISYSLYLIHVPVVGVVVQTWGSACQDSTRSAGDVCGQPRSQRSRRVPHVLVC
jgi:death-on-curing protein